MRTDLRTLAGTLLLFLLALHPEAARPPLPLVAVEPQPLAAQVARVAEALAYIGAPLSAEDRRALEQAAGRSDAAPAIQAVLDRHCLLDVHINPESRVKVHAGPGARRARRARLADVPRQGAQRSRRDSAAARDEPQRATCLLPRSAWLQHGSATCADDHGARRRPIAGSTSQYVRQAAAAPTLSGLDVEYRILQLYSRDPGKREAKLAANVGQGSQDIGFRNDVAVLFTVHPSVDVTLRVADEHGTDDGRFLDSRRAASASIPRRPSGWRPTLPSIRRSIAQTASPSACRRRPTRRVTRGPEYVASGGRFTCRRAPLTASFPLERWIDPVRAAGSPATITSTPPAARTTRRRPRASTRTT